MIYNLLQNKNRIYAASF